VPFYSFAKPVLFRVDAETMHNRTLDGLALVSRSRALTAAAASLYRYDDPRLAVNVFGATFSNPVGVAAGLDKNGIAVPALLALGFGFVEIGTVTPVSQPGNPKPRVFRLPEDDALINRLGFPGKGVEQVERNLARFHDRLGPLGCNIGPNKTSVAAGTADRDWVTVLKRLQGAATYLVVNISSPNTAELRQLQGKAALHHLLKQVMAARSAVEPKPVLVKISPDMTEQELDDVLEVVSDVGLDGIVATNTTVDRPHELKDQRRVEAGGLSGRPLTVRSRNVVAKIYRRTGGALPIIAAGGIFTGADAIAAIQAGASLVQTYTGFVYRGPGAARDIKREMSGELDRLGATSLNEIRGV